ncbi:MAG: transcriptional regulator [Thermoanaerobaculales bacterium]
MSSNKDELQNRTRDGLSALDRLLEHRARLAICVLLSRERRFSFSRLKQVLGETDGSLGAHLRKLEDAGYVAVNKEFADRKPVSWYRLEPQGRDALTRHLGGLSRLIAEAGKGPS